MDLPQILAFPQATAIARKMRFAQDYDDTRLEQMEGINAQDKELAQREQAIVNQFDLDRAKPTLINDAVPILIANGPIVQRFFIELASSDPLRFYPEKTRRETVVNGQLSGQSITVRTITSGRARFQGHALTFNTEEKLVKEFPAYLVKEKIHVVLPNHSSELSISINVWDCFRTKLRMYSPQQRFCLTIVCLEAGYSTGSAICPLLGIPYERLQITIEDASIEPPKLYSLAVVKEKVYVSNYEMVEERWIFLVEKLWTAIYLATRYPPLCQRELLQHFSDLMLAGESSLQWKYWLTFTLGSRANCPIESRPLPVAQFPLEKGMDPNVKYAPESLSPKAQHELEAFYATYQAKKKFPGRDAMKKFFQGNKVCTVSSEAKVERYHTKLLEFFDFYVTRSGPRPVGSITSSA